MCWLCVLLNAWLTSFVLLLAFEFAVVGCGCRVVDGE
jgi:hypothetical protein